MAKILYALLAAPLLAPTASAQTVLHYWDFESTNDVVGGVTTTSVGTTDLSLDGTYGEAYLGSNQSLNSVLGGTGAGGGHLSADVFDGSATALDFGTSNFSFSYWSYNANDGDGRGPRVFDNLEGITTGLQLGTVLTGEYNLRMDDSLGGSTVLNATQGITQSAGAWVHVVVNVDRGAAQVEVFFGGVSQGSFALANNAAGALRPSMDMEIGAINGGTNEGQSQEAGLDDLAFYDDLLGAMDIAGLAAGTLTPLDFLPPVVPANDDCADRIAVFEGTNAFSNEQATDSGVAMSCSGSGGSNDVWYTFTPDRNASYTISTCGSAFDTVIAIYSGTCGNLMSLACDDDDPCDAGFTLQSLVDSGPLVAGTDYYIQIGGFGSNEGSGDLNITKNPGAQNYCSSNVNSSGNAATMSYLGSTSVGDDTFDLQCSGMPVDDEFGWFAFIVALDKNNAPLPFGGSGQLCVSDPFCRLYAPGLSVGGVGTRTLTAIDFGPAPMGNDCVFGPPTAGAQFYFQCLFRDNNAMPAQALVSSDGLCVTFGL